MPATLTMQRSHSRPGRLNSRPRSGGSKDGASSTTPFRQVVPSTVQAEPAASPPEPMTLAATSPAPVTTGVPARSPVSAAAASVTVPAIASDGSTGGSKCRCGPRPNSSSIASLRPWARASPGATDVSVGSAARWPVRRKRR